MSMMDSAPGNEIKVAIRVRPLLPKEQAGGLKSRWLCTDTTICPDSSQASGVSYVYDRVFNEEISNRIVYEELAADIVKQAMIGFNGTLFTYGQSGSGKTYTIDALRTFAIKSAYDYIENCPAREFLMRVSYIELYNEKLMDLLSDDNTPLIVREDNERNVSIEGLKEIIVMSQDHVKTVLTQGNARRTFAATKLNDRSSRAHCIFRLVIESRERDDPEHSSVFVSYLNLVDLAGSERAGENSGERLREGVSINLSLLTLSQVIRKLSGEQREFINYRDSKLTRILQNALEGNSKTAILCTIAPISVEETHSTLRFALNAKKVKTKPKQNEVLTDSAMLKKSQLEITRLKNKIKELEGRNTSQESGELQLEKEKWRNLISEVGSFLCVSSKPIEEKRPDKKRRETVCVPQIYRTADAKDVSLPMLPSIIPKGRLFEPLQKPAVTPPESSPLMDSVASVPHPLDYNCLSSECSCLNMSFTSIEKTLVQDNFVEKYKSHKAKCNAKFGVLKREIAKLKSKLRQKSGQFVTLRKRYKPNDSLGTEFHNVVFHEADEDFETNEVLLNQATRALDEEAENTLLGNETMKSEMVEELDGVRSQLDSLTARVAELGKINEDYVRTIAELRGKISRDEDEIQALKASLEDKALMYSEESKKWNEKVQNLETDKELLEFLCQDKGVLETGSAGKLEDKNGEEKLLERQNEILTEWEQVSKLKEELNEQAMSVESKLFLMEEERRTLNTQKDWLNEEKNALNMGKDLLNEEKSSFIIEKDWLDEEKNAINIEKDWINEERSKLYTDKNWVNEERNIINEEKDRLNEERNIINEEKDRLNEERSAVDEQKDRLSEEKDRLSEEKDRLNEEREQIHAEWNNLEKAYDDLRQENEDHNRTESSIETIQALQKENGSSIETIQALQKENGSFIETIQALQKDNGSFIETIQALQKDNGSFIETIQALQKENGSSIETVQALQKENGSSIETIQALQKENESFIETVQALQKENGSFIETVQALQKENERFIEKLHALQEENDQLRTSMRTASDMKSNGIGFIHEVCEQGLEMDDNEESVQETDKPNVWEIERRLQRQWDNLKEAQEIFRQEREDYELKKMKLVNLESELDKREIIEGETQDRELDKREIIEGETQDRELDKREIIEGETQDREQDKREIIEGETQDREQDKREIIEGETQDREQEMVQLALSDLSQNYVNGQQDSKAVDNIDNCVILEERESLLKELKCLKLSVSKLNRRKEALEKETQNFILKEINEDSAECELRRADLSQKENNESSSECELRRADLSQKENNEDNTECELKRADLSQKDRLQEEWEILRKEQKELESRKLQMEEQKRDVHRKVDKCLILEEEIQRLEQEVKLLRDAQWEKTMDKEILDVTAAVGIDLSNEEEQRQQLTNESSGDWGEEMLDLAKQKEMLQREWGKLERQRAELCRQEDNVERKIDRLCMLEEEKEQFEEERSVFETEMENLRQAQKQFLKEQEAFRLTRLESLNKVEEKSEDTDEGRNRGCGALKDAGTEPEKSWESEAGEKELRQNEGVNELEEVTCRQESTLLHERGEEGYVFTRTLRVEKEELKLEGVEIERNCLSVDANTEEEAERETVPQCEDESGIVTDISWRNSTLSMAVQARDEVIDVSVHEELGQTTVGEKETFSGESINLNQTQKISKDMYQRHNEKMKTQINSEVPQVLLDTKLLQQSMDRVKQDEENLRRKQEMLREREEYVQQSMEKLQTLEEKEKKIQIEREQLCEEKEIFNMERERFQQEMKAFEKKEMLKEEKDVYWKEEMLKEKKEGFHLEEDMLKQGLHQEEEMLKQGLYKEEEMLKQGLYKEEEMLKQGLHQEKEMLKQGLHQEEEMLKQGLHQEEEMLKQGLHQEEEMLKQGLYKEEEMLKQGLHQEEEKQGLHQEEDQQNSRQELEVLRGQEWQVQQAIERLRTLEEKEKQLNVESQQLYEEKGIFKLEKDKFQQEKEEFEREKERFQGEKEGSLDERECLQELGAIKETHCGLIQNIQSLSNEENNILCVQSKERFHNEIESFTQAGNSSRKETSSQTENSLLDGDNMENVKCSECMQQKCVILMENESKRLQGGKDEEGVELEESCRGDVKDLDKSDLSDMELEESCRGDVKDLDKSDLNDMELLFGLNKQEYVEEMNRMPEDSSWVVENTDREATTNISIRKGRDADITQDNEIEEDRKLLEIEKERLRSAWDNLRQSQDDLKKEQQKVSQMSAELVERMQAVLEIEQNRPDKEEGCTTQEQSEKQQGHEEQAEQILELEEELDCKIVELEKAEKKIADLQNLIVKGKAMLAEKIDLVVDEKEKERLDDDRGMLQEEWNNLRLSQEDFNREKELKIELEKDCKMRTEQLQLLEEEHKRMQRSLYDFKQAGEMMKREQDAMSAQRDGIHIEIEQLQTLQQEKEILQVEIEKLNGEKSQFEKEIDRLDDKKYQFEKEIERLDGEKFQFETEIERLNGEKSLFEKEMERFRKEKETIQEKLIVLQKERELFEQERNTFLAEKDEFCREKVLFSDIKASIQEKELFEQERNTFLAEKDEFCREKVLFSEIKASIQEDQERYQNDRKLFNKNSTALEEDLQQLQKEKEIFQDKEAVLQEKQEQLEKDREVLMDELAAFQLEKDKFQRAIHELQEEKVLLQDERNRLHEVERNVQKMSEDLKEASDCLRKNEEELCMKEKTVESRIERAFIREDERQKFDEAQENFRKEMISLNEREVSFEDNKKRLQNLLEFEKEEMEKQFKDEKERLQSAWDILRQSQDDLKKEQQKVSKMSAEVDERMQAVLEIEQNRPGKDEGCTTQEESEKQQGHEEQAEQIWELEEELDCKIVELEKAEKKIADLQNLIVKGKAMLAEKIDLAKQAEDRSKELEESIGALRSTLNNKSSLLDAKSEELEKLKGVQEKYKAAVREQDGLKNEIEAMTKGRAGDKKYFEDIIRHLKLKQRDAQSAEASFMEQRNHSSQPDPSNDQLRRIIEFENAAKFMELNTLKKTVEEQKAQIKSLEAERAQLQEDCKTLQLHVDNETMRSEAMFSLVNQKALAKNLIEEELIQLRKQLAQEPNLSKDSSAIDEATQMLRSQLKEKDQLIGQLSRTIDLRNGKWNAIAAKHKDLIQQNQHYQKTVTELQKENAEVAKLRAECAELVKSAGIRDDPSIHRKEISQNMAAVASNSEKLAALQKENTELQASLVNLKSELQSLKNKKTHKENPSSQQHGSGTLCQPQQPSTHTNSSHTASKQPQVEQNLDFRYGGAVESYVIALRDKEIRDLKRRLETQSEMLKEVEQNKDSNFQKPFGSDVKGLSEECRLRSFMDNSRDKENQPSSHH